MRPLTHTRPKPALRVAGKTLIEHNLDQLVDLVEEALIVIGYEGDVIKKEIGENYRGIKIRYVTQEKQLGTGDAAKAALPFLDDQFLVLNGDDLYKGEDLKKCMAENPCIMVKRVDDPDGFGQILHENGKVKDLIEKPSKNVSNLVNIGAYFINKSFFDEKITKSKRGEYEITDYIKSYLKRGDLHYHVAENWDPVSYPWNLLELTGHIFDDLEEKKEGRIEENVCLKEKVVIEKGAVIKAGTTIEGPAYIGKNSEIGPNAYIRPGTSIDEGVKIGQSVEVKNSVIGRNTHIPHLSYVSDSVLGECCSLGAGTITSNFKFDKTEVKTEVKGEIMSTGRKKLGAIFGDGVKTGINVSLMPGVMIGTRAMIYSDTTVNKNVKKEKVYKK